MRNETTTRGWVAAGWIGVIAGLFDTALPLLHPAPWEAIPFGVLLYGLTGILLYAALNPLAALAVRVRPRWDANALALGLIAAAFTAFFGLYFVTTSTLPFLMGRSGQIVALAGTLVLAMGIGALVRAFPRGPLGRACSRAAALWILIVVLLVYPFLAARQLLRNGAHEPDGAPAPRGLVLVSLDAMRGDRISALGYPRPITPHIDELVAGGTAFSRALVQAPASAPGHACMLTGLPPLAHGVLANAQILDDTVITVAERLHDEGFATAALANNFYLESRYGFDQGFDLFIDRYQATHLDGFHPRHVLRATALFHAWARSFRVPGRRNDDTIEGALAWLEHRPAGDFFLFLHIMDPHSPYEPPPDLVERFYSPDGEPVRDTEELRARMEGGLTETEVSALRDLYDADIALGDRKVGRLIATLKRLGLMDSTLIVITADHGEVLYERDDTFDHGLAWDGDLHVPLVFHHPTRVPVGLVCPDPVSATALVPTVFSLLELPYQEQCEPAFSAPLLVEGRATPAPPPVCSLTGVIADLDAATATGPRYKIVMRKHRLEDLYDLQADPTEQINLWPGAAEASPDSDHVELAQDYERELREWLQATRKAAVVVGPRADEALDADTRRRLKALGYID